MVDAAAASVSRDRLGALIRDQLPPAAVVHVAGSGDHASADAQGPPGASPRSGAADRLRRGRACAARALSELGSTVTDVGRGPRREPLWPPGFVGSITHLDALSAAAIAPVALLVAIGIDAARNRPLPEGVEALVVGDPAELPAGDDAAAAVVNCPTVLFSAKESIYKAWHPVRGTWLDFHDVRVELLPETPTDGGFRVEPGSSRSMTRAESGLVADLVGGYRVDAELGFIATSAVVGIDPGRWGDTRPG